jgi:hypothetical protein
VSVILQDYKAEAIDWHKVRSRPATHARVKAYARLQRIYGHEALMRHIRKVKAIFDSVEREAGRG